MLSPFFRYLSNHGLKSGIKNIATISGIPNALGTYDDTDGFPGEKVDVKYQTWDDVKNTWLPNVLNNSDYAGIYGHDVCAIYINLSQDNVYYRVHTKGGKWLPEVKGREDYAGIYNKPINAIAIKNAKYRVHIKNGDWLPVVDGYNTKDSKNGYAGNGKEIDDLHILEIML